MTQYPRDEFDQVPESSARQGVHRTVAAAARKRLWPVMAAGAVALLMGLAAFFIFPTLGLGPAGTPVAVTDSPSPSQEPAPTEAPTSDAPEPAPVTPEDEPPAEPDPEPSEAAAVVDKTQAVAVFNGTGTPGLAGRVGGVVQADGWPLAEVGNWSGNAQPQSVIFYSGPEQLANAQTLAGLLGIPAVVESADFQLPLVVVLGPGYQ